MALTDKLTAIANAIRKKTGKSAKLTLDQMPTEIESIQTGSSDIPFNLSGMNAVKVAEYNQTWGLEDTSFEIGVSSSTSATTIRATTTNQFTNTTGSPTVAFGDKDIIVVQRVHAKPTHVGSNQKAEVVAFAGVYVTWFSKRKTTDTSAKTTRQPYNSSCYILKYYNTAGTMTRAVTNYGFYMTPQAPTVASATAASTYVRASSPVISYRVSSSYESAANIKLVTECSFDWKVEVYTVDSGSNITGTVNDELDRIILNGI